PFDQVAPFDFHGQGLIQRIGGPDIYLYLHRGPFPDEQVVLAFEVIHDGFVHLVAGHADGTRINDAGERNDGDIGSSPTDVNHHVAAGFSNGQTGADGSNHGLLHQEHFAGFGAVGGVFDCTLFHLGDLRRHADHDSRVHQHFAVVRLLNEVIQHLFGNFEIGDHAIFHRLYGNDVAGSAAKHLLGLFADRFHFASVFVDRDDRGLIDNDALAPRVH